MSMGFITWTSGDQSEFRLLYTYLALYAGFDCMEDSKQEEAPAPTNDKQNTEGVAEAGEPEKKAATRKFTLTREQFKAIVDESSKDDIKLIWDKCNPTKVLDMFMEGSEKMVSCVNLAGSRLSRRIAKLAAMAPMGILLSAQLREFVVSYGDGFYGTKGSSHDLFISPKSFLITNEPTEKAPSLTADDKRKIEAILEYEESGFGASGTDMGAVYDEAKRESLMAMIHRNLFQFERELIENGKVSETTYRHLSSLVRQELKEINAKSYPVRYMLRVTKHKTADPERVADELMRSGMISSALGAKNVCIVAQPFKYRLCAETTWVALLFIYPTTQNSAEPTSDKT